MRRTVTGIFSSPATRRTQVFTVVGFVPSGSVIRVAVLSRDWIFPLKAL